MKDKVYNIYDGNEVAQVVRWFKLEENLYLNEIRNYTLQNGVPKGFKVFAQTIDNTSWLNDINLALVNGYTIATFGREQVARVLFFNLFTFRKKEEAKIIKKEINYIQYFIDNPKTKSVMVNDKIKAIRADYITENKTKSKVVYYDTEKKRFTKNPNKN